MNTRKILAILAVLGALLVLVARLLISFPLQPNQEWSYVLLVLAGFLVPLAIYMLMPRAFSRLTGSPELLVPLGVYLLASWLIGWAAGLSALKFLTLEWMHFQVLRMSFVLSAGLLIHILLTAFYAAWQTTAILNAIRHGDSDAERALVGAWKWFPRVLVLYCLGWGGIYLILLGGMCLFAAGSPAVGAALVLMALLGLFWSFITAASLPAALDSGLNLVEAIRQGLLVSLRGIGRWWAPLALQLALLGFIVYLHVSRGSSSSATLNVNLFWLGGYPDDCKWHGALLNMLGTSPVPAASYLLGLLFAILAMAVKLTIVERMDGLDRTDRRYSKLY